MFNIFKNKCMKLNNSIFRRNFLTRPPNSLDILMYGKTKINESLSRSISVGINENCYKCYQIMIENNLSYLPIVDNDKQIGFLSRFDVESMMNLHEYEEEETERIREDLRCMPH